MQPQKDLARDDIVDPLMCLCIALLPDEELKKEPLVPRFDANGLPIQMLYVGQLPNFKPAIMNRLSSSIASVALKV